MYQSITIMGRIGAIYDTTTTPSGAQIGVMSVAVSKKVKGVEKTQWFRAKYFNKTAEIVGQYLEVGCRVMIVGEMEFGEYTNKDNVKVNTAELIVNRLQIVDFKKTPKDEESADAAEFTPDDIPF